MASPEQNAKIKERRKNDPVFAAKLREREAVKTRRISERRRIAREAKVPNPNAAANAAVARWRDKVLSDPVRAAEFREKAKAKTQQWRDDREWKTVQRRSANWVWLCNRIPGCFDPKWCSDCKQWFKSEDHSLTSGRCWTCARAYGKTTCKTVVGRVTKRKNNRARVHRLRAGGPFPQKEWEALLFRCGGKCVKCLSASDITIDHIVPVSQGGSNDISNLQPLCRSCNCRKNDTTADYRPLRYAR